MSTNRIELRGSHLPNYYPRSYSSGVGLTIMYFLFLLFPNMLLGLPEDRTVWVTHHKAQIGGAIVSELPSERFVNGV